MHYQCNCTYMKSQRQQRINCYIQFYWLPSFQSIPLVSVDSMVSFGRSLTVSPNGDPDGVVSEWFVCRIVTIIMERLNNALFHFQYSC